MKKIVLPIILLLLSFTTKAQSLPFDWETLLLDSNRTFCFGGKSITKMVTEGDYIYIGFYHNCGNGFLPDQGGETDRTLYGQHYIAKLDKFGKFYWSRALQIARNASWDFDVHNEKVYLTALMSGDLKIGNQIISKTGDEQMILLALDPNGTLLWHKRSPHYDSYMDLMAISINNNKIAVAVDNYRRRNLIRFDSDEIIPLDNFYHNILQVYDTLGNFKNYQAFNSLRYLDSRTQIVDIQPLADNFLVKLGLPGAYTFGYDTVLTYEQVKVYNPTKNELSDQFNFAAYHLFEIEQILPILDNRFLVRGYSTVPTIEIQERFKLNCNSNNERCQFIALLDQQGVSIWSKSIDNKKAITDLAYDDIKQEIYTSTVERASKDEREQTGKDNKNIISKLSKHGELIDSNLIFTHYTGGPSPMLSLNNSSLYYTNLYEVRIPNSNGESGFRIAKINFPERTTPLATQTVLYPNPANDYLVLKGLNNENIDLKIFSSNGQAITNYNYEVKDNLSVVYIDNLTDGIYFLKMTDDNSTQTFKFIKQ
jgi:hypothetical protein